VTELLVNVRPLHTGARAGHTGAGGDNMRARSVLEFIPIFHHFLLQVVLALV
jgi:hypothetical protein